MLHDGQVFLQYDSGVNDKNRFLIFASNQGLDDLLVLNKQWACDGTFKYCLSIFYQLYIIHVRVREIYIPRLFALLPNKAQHTYNLLFEKLLELRPALAPDTVMLCFFEKLLRTQFKIYFLRYLFQAACSASARVYTAK